VADTIKLTIDGKSVDALLGLPETQGPHPAVLVAHHQEGLSPFTRDLVDKFARSGYVAICPDHYHRFPPDTALETLRNSVRDRDVLQELGAARDFLRKHPQVDPTRIAVMGHCMGGRLAFLAASHFPGFKAAAIFYPTAMLTPRPGGFLAIDTLAAITCPVIAFFGETDWLIPKEHADKIEAELRFHHIPLEIYRYPDAGHAFANFSSAQDFRPTAAEDSWRKAMAFLDRHLKAVGSAQ
jgi:carboxymethylenebutenolidase